MYEADFISEKDIEEEEEEGLEDIGEGEGEPLEKENFEEKAEEGETV